MPFAIVKRGIFGPKVIRAGIARREPPAHLADAGTAFFRTAFLCGTVRGGALRFCGALLRGYRLVIVLRIFHSDYAYRLNIHKSC